MAVYNFNRLFLNVIFILLISLTITNAFWNNKKEAAATPATDSTENTKATETIVQETPEVPAEHEEQHPDEEKFEDEMEGGETFQDDVAGRTDLHIAAAEGSVDTCAAILGEEETDILHARDENGWQAIHEASREGHVEVVKFLVEKGADIGALTNGEETPLSVARDSLEEGHELILFLEEIGAPDSFIPEEDVESGDPLDEQEQSRGDEQ